MGHITLATKTVAMIDDMIQKDQGSAYRGWLGQVIPHMGDAYRVGEENFRSHLGASLLGGECARSIWYGFRWTKKSNFPGRILRLFNRGHLEEARFIAMLLMIGCKIFQQDENGKQYRISWAEGHAGGSGDGIAIGIPDLPPDTPTLTEFKTHNDASFKELKTKGVREAKFEHYVQMNIYLRKMGLTSALYLAVNKNTDELYGEILHLDSYTADQFIERGEKIVWLEKAPDKINQSPAFFKCKFCDFHSVCHRGDTPSVNCRTCAYSKPSTEGRWVCNLEDAYIDKDVQLVGCPKYEPKVM